MHTTTRSRTPWGVGGFAIGLLIAGCTGDPAPAQPEPWVWALPPGFPEPLVPADNPMTVEKVALGEALFHDPRLSWNESLSCATCHDVERAFTDGQARPTGSDGTELQRNAMGLLNAAWLVPYTWANPQLETLEEQALVPLFGDFPLELGLQRDTDAILGRFTEDPELAAAFEAAFPEADDPITTDTVVQALSSYQRTLTSADSGYDRFFYEGDASGMSEAAQRGMALFFSERTECYHCHGGFLFTSAVRSAAQPGVVPGFFNTGLYDVGGTGDYPTGNQGLFELTGDPRDRGKFRVPSLRNVAVTAPYMHDGSIATLAEVVAIYSAGGRHIEDGELAGDGREHPNKDTLVFELALTDGEQAELVAFLEALTDSRFMGG
jgi:cytochrome c peroxidase